MLHRTDKKWFRNHIAAILKAAFPGSHVSVGATPGGGRYPCEWFSASAFMGLDFPADVENDYGKWGYGEMLLMLRPFADSVRERFRAALEPFGCDTFDEYWDGYTPSCCFPPSKIFLNDEYDKHASQYGRWMTPEEIATHVAEHGQEPFWDEQWITLKYAGVNFPLTFRWYGQRDSALQEHIEKHVCGAGI